MALRLSLPMFSLCTLTVLMTGAFVTILFLEAPSSVLTTALWYVAFPTLLAWWIEHDRRTKRYAAPFEFSAFVFFLWPVIVPYYLTKTRGWRGLLMGLGFWVWQVLPFYVAVEIYEFVRF